MLTSVSTTASIEDIESRERKVRTRFMRHVAFLSLGAQVRRIPTWRPVRILELVASVIVSLDLTWKIKDDQGRSTKFAAHVLG